MTPHAKFHVNLHKGASWQIGEIYTKIFVAIYLFFRNSPTGQTLWRIFACDGSNDAVLRMDVIIIIIDNRGLNARWCLMHGCAFWELKNLKLIFNVFIQKNSKKLQWSLMRKIKLFLKRS